MNMAKLHDQKYYLKMCARMVEEIKKLAPIEENRPLFVHLRKKAAKYLRKAQAFEKIRPSADRIV